MVIAPPAAAAALDHSVFSKASAVGAEVRRAILRCKSLGSLPDIKLAAVEGRKKLQADIREATSRLHRDQTF